MTFDPTTMFTPPGQPLPQQPVQQQPQPITPATSPAPAAAQPFALPSDPGPLQPAQGAPSAFQVPQQTAHQNVQYGALNDDEIKTGDYEAYKARKGHVDRVSLIAPRKLCWGRAHYIQEKGYFVCTSVFEKQGGQEVPVRMGACCQKLGLPKKRFTMLLAHYVTDVKGAVLQPLQFSLKVWRFGEQVFDQLRSQNRELPFEQHDILISCSDEQYQRLTFSACREAIAYIPAFRAGINQSTGRTYGDEIDAYIAAMSQRLDRIVATVATPQEWAVLLGAPGVGGEFAGVGGVTTDQPVEDIRQLLGGISK